MDLKNFSKEVAAILPYIHVELLKRQPAELVKSRISFTQMVILGILSRMDNAKMGDLSKTLGVTKSAVTGLIDRLIRAGLVRRSRSKEDRRIVRVSLTSKGMALSKKIDDFKLNGIGSLFSNINQDERMQYLVILRKLRSNIQAKLEYKFYA